MKNKKYSQWLHRLPVLLLALILVVMPLALAVPSNASVISGSPSSWEIWYGTFGMSGDVFSDNYVYFAGGSSGSFIYGYYFSANPIAVSYSADGVVLSGSDIYSVLNLSYSSGLSSPLVVENEGIWPEGDSVTIRSTIIGISYSGNVTVPDALAPFRVYPVIHQTEGVTDVFTGVGTWLSGAVQNISTMFWTAETGMTVLGYLAVASLALAVILLIFYLIAGWLKFH